MKNIKGLIFGAGVLGSAFVSLGWWCDHCGKYHSGKCPWGSLFGCGYGYNCGYGCDADLEYDSEGEEKVLAQLQQRRREHHRSNIDMMFQKLRQIEGMLKHARSREEIHDLFRGVMGLKDAILRRERELFGNVGCGCYDCGGYGSQSSMSSYGCDEDNSGYGCGYGCSYDPYYDCGGYGSQSSRSSYGCGSWDSGYGC